MLKNISLENFKAFEKLNDLEIKPLTILCGVNSGGKSSIIKSLLLLKQSYENVSAANEATLNGIYTNNGLMKDILYNGKGETFTIKNKFNIKFRGKKYIKNAKQDISTAKELGKITGLNPGKISSFDINVLCCVKQGSVSEIWDTNFIERMEIIITPIGLNGCSVKDEEFKINMQYRSRGKGKYDIDLINFPTISGKKESCKLDGCVCYFSGMRLTNLYYEVGQSENKSVVLNDFLTNIYSIFRIISDQYNGIKYLGPLRENPRRQYAINSDCYTTNSTGIDTPFILAKEKGKRVIAELYPPEDEFDFSKKYTPNEKSLFELVQMWMRYFEAGNISIENRYDSLQVKIKSNNIADVGFGISQILPVIVHGLAMDFEQTLILEQPELHLHPRMQMRMSDFLLSLSETNHCVIVETHSDHIINRLVRRALESGDNSIVNNIAIYFVNNTENGSTVENIKIDMVRGITDCPKEFFSQFASETSYIIKAGINNMGKEEL